jgi:hypothetical protein
VEPRRTRWTRWAVGSAVVLALFVGAFLVLPQLLIPNDLRPEREQLALENDVRTSAAQAVAGLLVLAGLGLTARTIAVTREGQLTERFSRAIEHLASDSLDVRLGGIYALDRLARASREDHLPAMAVLLAYAARRFPWPPAEDTPPSRDDRTPPDLDAICEAVRGRRADYETTEDTPILRHIDLRRTGWHDAELRAGIISDCSLAGAYFAGADLSGAMLINVDLTGTSLEAATLKEAHAPARDVVFRGVSAEDADFREGDFQGLMFLDADLANADLRKADLRGSDFTRADLTGARLDGARLEGSKLELARGLTKEQLAQAKTDEATTVPKSLR